MPTLKPLGLRILLEPGRFLVGNAGVLLSTVQYLKTTDSGKKFVIVDAGMNDLIRPALYEGYHEIVPVREPAATDPRETADVVGPVCESGDFFAQARELPPLRQGELIALMSAGAYGFAMASNYNSRPLAAEVMVSGKTARVVRDRQTFRDLIRGSTGWTKPRERNRSRQPAEIENDYFPREALFPNRNSPGPGNQSEPARRFPVVKNARYPKRRHGNPVLQTAPKKPTGKRFTRRVRSPGEPITFARFGQAQRCGWLSASSSFLLARLHQATTPAEGCQSHAT